MSLRQIAIQLFPQLLAVKPFLFTGGTAGQAAQRIGNLAFFIWERLSPAVNPDTLSATVLDPVIEGIALEPSIQKILHHPFQAGNIPVIHMFAPLLQCAHRFFQLKNMRRFQSIPGEMDQPRGEIIEIIVVPCALADLLHPSSRIDLCLKLL